MYNKGIVENKISNVVSEEEFLKSPDRFEANDYTAIHRNGLLFPLRSPNDVRPGVYSQYPMLYYIEPREEDRKKYSDSTVIDFDNVKDISDMIEKQNQLKGQEMAILTSPDNIYTPVIMESDAPEMRLMKEAIIAKHIDLDKYEQRFGSNYTNDKRILNRSNITLSKIKSMCKALDIEAELVFRDKEPNVANPMKKEISVILTEGVDDDESETND